MAEGTGFENRHTGNRIASSNLASSVLTIFGRLAQLAERLVDVEKARGSSPLPPIHLYAPFFEYTDYPRRVWCDGGFVCKENRARAP